VDVQIVRRITTRRDWKLKRAVCGDVRKIYVGGFERGGTILWSVKRVDEEDLRVCDRCIWGWWVPEFGGTDVLSVVVVRWGT
jgi:hypothetical protein